MPVAKGLPLGLSQNEVNDGLDELPGFLRHHLPGSRICVGLWYDDKGGLPLQSDVPNRPIILPGRPWGLFC